MSDDRSYPQASGPIARERATIEARFYAGLMRLWVTHPPGSWPRSPQLPPGVPWRQGKGSGR